MGGSGKPLRAAAMTVARYCEAEAARQRQVSIGLSSRAKAREPCSERVPRLMWRAEPKGARLTISQRSVHALALQPSVVQAFSVGFAVGLRVSAPSPFRCRQGSASPINANWGQTNGGQPMCDRALLAVHLHTPRTGRSFPPLAATRVLKSPPSGQGESPARHAADRNGARGWRR